MAEAVQSSPIVPDGARRRNLIARMLIDYPATIYAWNENKGAGRLVDRMGHGDAVWLGTVVFLVGWVFTAAILGAVGLGTGAAVGAVFVLGEGAAYKGMELGFYVTLWAPVAAVLYLVWGGLVWAFASHLVPESDRTRRARQRRR